MFCCEAKTQTNLVYNGDFELYDTCPTNISTPGDLQIEHCLGWTAPHKLGTSDYFNVCNNLTFFKQAGIPKNFFGYQYPYNGNGFCGFYSSIVDSFLGQPYIYREYLQTKLTQPLEKNKSYGFSFFVSACGESNTHSLINLGALFSSSNFSANNYDPIFASPQIKNKNTFLFDTLNWMKIEGTFMANGNEEYLTIGYFENATVDTLNNHYDPFNFYYTIETYYYVDGVSLLELPCTINIPNVFTPNGDNVNDEFKIELCDSTNFNLIIYNRWGNIIFESSKSQAAWNGRTTSGEVCVEGTYYFAVTTDSKKEKGFIQLVR